MRVHDLTETADTGEATGDTAAGGGTPDRLISAAEHLFAVHGIDGVSLREITRAAGARMRDSWTSRC